MIPLESPLREGERCTCGCPPRRSGGPGSPPQKPRRTGGGTGSVGAETLTTTWGVPEAVAQKLPQREAGLCLVSAPPVSAHPQVHPETSLLSSSSLPGLQVSRGQPQWLPSWAEAGQGGQQTCAGLTQERGQ